MSGPFAEGAPGATPPAAPREFTESQRAGRARMPCVGRKMGNRTPCDYPSIVELVVHEQGSEHRLVAPVCFAHAVDLMHGEPADHVLDLYRYRLDKI